jgi:hypothetical protein
MLDITAQMFTALTPKGDPGADQAFNIFIFMGDVPIGKEATALFQGKFLPPDTQASLPLQDKQKLAGFPHSVGAQNAFLEMIGGSCGKVEGKSHKALLADMIDHRNKHWNIFQYQRKIFPSPFPKNML